MRENAGIAHLLALARTVYDEAVSLRTKYEGRCVGKAFFAGSTRSASAFTGYAGTNGTVYLAGNRRPPEMTSAEPGRWTQSDERSTLLIELAPATHALEAEIYVTHFVAGSF